MLKHKAIRDLISRSFNRIKNCFKHDVAGVNLFDNSLRFKVYLTFFFCILLLLTLITFSRFDYLLSIKDSNQIILGFGGLIFALLIPVSVALIEDSRDELSFFRQTIILRIINMRELGVALILIFMYLVLPYNFEILDTSLTLRKCLSGICLIALLWMGSSLYRSYLWLTDPSDFWQGRASKPKNASSVRAYPSYRFSHLLQAASFTNSDYAWSSIFSRWYPEDYEFVIHTYFFKRCFSLEFETDINKLYQILNDLRSYLDNLELRNLDSPYYCVEYQQNFLNIELLIIKRLARLKDVAGFTENKIIFSSAERTIGSINQKIIANGLKNNNEELVLKNMEEYAGELIKLQDNLSEAKVRVRTLNSYIKLLLDDHISNSVTSVDHDLSNSKFFKIDYPHKHPLTEVVTNALFNWVEKQSQDSIESISRVYPNNKVVEKAFVLLFGRSIDVNIALELLWYDYLLHYGLSPAEIIDKLCVHPEIPYIFTQAFQTPLKDMRPFPINDPNQLDINTFNFMKECKPFISNTDFLDGLLLEVDWALESNKSDSQVVYHLYLIQKRLRVIKKLQLS